MATQFAYTTIALADLHSIAQQRKAEGWRYVQTTCVVTDNGFDVIYTFAKDDVMENLTIESVSKEDEIQSISDLFFSAFVFENEAHDLFGVNIKGIVIDFGGNFYALSQREPMTVISPAKKAARDKAAKLAAAKAAKEAKASQPDTAAEDAELEAKLAAMDPEKAAKVRAAMEAKKAKAAAAAAAQEDAELEAKLAAMDPEKAAKVRAAMEAKKAKAAAAAATKEGEAE